MVLEEKEDDYIKRKLVHLGFRIDENVLEGIKKTARRTETTVSNQINIILRNWVTRDTYFQELGFIPMSKDILRAWISKMEQSELITQGKEFGLAAAEFIAYFFGEINVSNMIKFLKILLSRFPSYDHRIENKTHSFHINHDICLKYSIFFSEQLKSLIVPIIKGPVKLKNLTQKTIIISFDIL
jgi:hypothetical protein